MSAPYLQVTSGLKEVALVKADGSVMVNKKLYGTFAAPLDLRRFPLDTQILPITVMSYTYQADEIQLVFSDGGRGERFSAAGWSLLRAKPKAHSTTASSTHGTGFKFTVSQLDYLLEMKRDVSYYIWKIILPLTIILLMSWAVFWIDPTHVTSQIAVAATSILTLIAFLLAIGRVLPRVSYLTRIDYFIFMALFLVFGAFAQGIATSTITAKGNHELGRRLDRWARVIFPTVFAGILVWFFV